MPPSAEDDSSAHSDYEDGEEEEEEEDEDFDDEEEEEQGEAEEGINAGIYNATDVNDQQFEELQLPADVVEEMQLIWDAFLKMGNTREAAGEALYSAVFDAAPSMQSLFRTPRAVMAMRFMNGLTQIVSSMSDPPQLKVVVETLGFQHLDLEVTVPRVIIFRDAMTDLFCMELGQMVTTRAREGWLTVLNYVGGAYIYIRVKYSERLRILAASWATANNRKFDENGEETPSDELKSGSADKKEEDDDKRKKKSYGFRFGRKKNKDQDEHERNDNSSDESTTMHNSMRNRNANVPTTYNEMFMFNAAVMGFGDKAWMNEVLLSFDTIVRNVSNSARLQEECDVLSLRISKYKGTIVLSEYKAVMLASLRSLVPKDWNSAHEISWSWLWENVERMIKANLGRPTVQERALSKLLSGMDDKTRASVRRDIYSSFFSLAPAGQEYFKQSTTRLHFIADRIVSMTLEIFRETKKMVEDISALGLRHVGYGIPTELFGPFVTSCVKVVRSFTDDDVAQEAFRWSLGLVSRILTRVINEGSTIVMKAINLNSMKQLKRAISCAPRGKRALWMLNIQVGTQSISPLLWAIETGSLEAARGIIMDLLTIRADRDHYYYGMDSMFERHPDIVKRLVQDAPALLATLFDGLIWRSRITENGMRRVNYYVKHLMVDSKGDFARTIEWIIENGDPKIVCHPVIAMVTDIIWRSVAFRAFLYGKAWVIFTLLIFIVGVAALEAETNTQVERSIIASCRTFTYVFSLFPRIYSHVKRTCTDCRHRDTVFVSNIPIPRYLTKWQDVVCLILTLTLIFMLIFEPILACLGKHEGDFDGAGLFTQVCEAGISVRFTYSVFGMCAICLYSALIIDLSVFSTRVSAFVLICFRVLSEVWLYIFGMAFVIATFSCGIAALRHQNDEFETIPMAILSLTKIALMMFETTNFNTLLDEPTLLITVMIYIILTVTFLLNLLIAQMNCAYQCVYEDMVGFARLNRGKIVTEAMPAVARWRWEKFIASLRLDEPCEFGEGDIGLSGAIQVFEPASQNITTVDMIRRFGGSTSPGAQWPEDDLDLSDENDRFGHMEKLLEKAIRRLSSKKDKKKGDKGSSFGNSSSVHSGSVQDETQIERSEAASND